MRKAIFLDRDGIINKDIGYVYRKEEVVFCEGIFNFCRKALENGFILIVITNQSGIARGYFTETDVQNLHIWMKEQFEKRGVTIHDFLYCPFHKKGNIPQYTKESLCRKPDPGMIFQASQKWDIDISQSFMIGDKPSDRIKLPELHSYIVKSQYTGDNYDFATLEELRLFLFMKA